MILGIETSCDETSVALLDSDGTVRVNLIASQIERHRPFGGVVPEIASREHLQHLFPLVGRALADAGASWSDIERIAVTAGPGLIGALLVGVAGAQGLSYALGVPLVPVNHLEGHIFSPYLQRQGAATPLPPRFLSLVISGGHSSIYDVQGGRPAMLNRTRDDAIGETHAKGCFESRKQLDALQRTDPQVAVKMRMKIQDRQRARAPEFLEQPAQNFQHAFACCRRLDLYDGSGHGCTARPMRCCRAYHATCGDVMRRAADGRRRKTAFAIRCKLSSRAPWNASLEDLMNVVTPLPKEKAAAEVHGIYDGVSKKFGKMPNIFGLMAHRPDVLAKFLPLYSAIIDGGTLEPRYKEFAYLKTSLINGCEY